MKIKETFEKGVKKVKENKKTIAKVAVVTLVGIGGALLLNDKNKKDKAKLESVDYSIEPDNDELNENENSMES